MTAGGGVTYPRVVELLKAEVAKKGQRATARDAKIALLSLQRYIKGIGEPSQASLQKIADYFGVAVGWLRSDGITGKHGGLDFNQVPPITVEELKYACPVELVTILKFNGAFRPVTVGLAEEIIIKLANVFGRNSEERDYQQVCLEIEKTWKDHYLWNVYPKIVAEEFIDECEDVHD